MGRENPADEERPESPADIGLDEMLTNRINAAPHTTAPKLARSLGISQHIVVKHLRDGLGMKYFHLFWVAHIMAEAQKVNRVAYMLSMTRVFYNNARTRLKYYPCI
jgi:hypothetical protein